MNYLNKENLFIIILTSLVFYSCSSNKNEPESPDPSQFPANFSYKLANNEVVITSFGESEEIKIPATITVKDITYPVTKIADLACNKSVKILHLPSSIKEIEADAFRINNITELYIEDLEAWCQIDFNYFDSWEQSFGSYNYSYANPLNRNTKFYVGNTLVEDLVIPFSIIELKPFTFAKLKTNSITFPEVMEKIGDDSFQSCVIPEIKIPETVKVIGASAFMNSSIKVLYTGNGVTDIRDKAFESSSLEEVYLGENIKELGELAFANINMPLVIHFNSDFSYSCDFERYTFKNSLLKCIDASDMELLINSGFMDNENLDSNYSIAINDKAIYSLELPISANGINITNIGGLTEIYFAEGITYVKGINISNNLESIYFPASLQEISMLDNCPNLKDIYCDAITPPYIGNNGGEYPYNCNEENCILHVPSGAMESYSSTPGWNKFKNIQPIL